MLRFKVCYNWRYKWIFNLCTTQKIENKKLKKIGRKTPSNGSPIYNYKISS